MAESDIDRFIRILLDQNQSEDSRDLARSELQVRVINGETDPQRMIDVVFQVFREEEQVMSNNAAWILVEVGTPSVPALIRGLRESRRVSFWSRTALGFSGLEARRMALPGIVELTHNPDPEIRMTGASAIESVVRQDLAEEGEDAVRRLGALLGDPDVSVRRTAVRSLSDMGSPAAPARKELETALASDDDFVRLRAGVALSLLGKQSLPRLKKNFEASTGTAKIDAAIALALVDRGSARTVPWLLSGLKVGTGETAAYSVTALTALGPRAKAAEEALTRMLADPDRKVRAIKVVFALDHIGVRDPELVPQLRSIIHSDPGADQNAVVLLGKIGPAASAAVPEMLSLMKGRVVGSCCSNEAEALVRIGTASISGLISAAASPDEYQRAWAAWALAQMLDSAPHAAPVIERAMLQDTHEVRFRAVAGAEIAGAKARPVARAIYKLLQTSGGGSESDRLQGTLAKMDGLDAAELVKALPNDILEFKLLPATAPFQGGQNAALQLAVLNHSSQSIRIMNPDCYRGNVSVTMVQRPGTIVIRRTHFFDHVVDVSDPDRATRIPPGAEARFNCSIAWSVAKWSKRDFPLFSYRYVGKEEKSDRQLRPGAYQAAAEYRFFSDDWKDQPEWYKELKSRYSDVWQGEAATGVVDFEVAP